MTVRASVTTNQAEAKVERVYDYEIDLPAGTPLEQVEAHMQRMFRILDAQSQAEPDEDEDEHWRKA